jgi:glycosyltransferase involved in cell wall biosynthesis
MSIAPLATIGISFKNPGSAFRLSLQSVFAQTCTDWELILFDDMSTDGSFEFASSIDDNRVRVIRDGQQQGLNIRLNQMVHLARGKFFFRMGADDVMHPDRISRQVSVLEKSDTDTVVGTACYSIDRDSVLVGHRPGQPFQQKRFEAKRSFHHPTVAAFTEWFRRNPYAERFPYFRSEDAELWCRTSENSRFVTLPEKLLFYREGASSFPAYVDTEMVLIHLLIERFQRPRKAYLISLLRELFKIALAAVLESFGKYGAFVSKRYSPLLPSEMAQAQAVLDTVHTVPLPIKADLGAKIPDGLLAILASG